MFIAIAYLVYLLILNIVYGLSEIYIQLDILHFCLLNLAILI